MHSLVPPSTTPQTPPECLTLVLQGLMGELERERDRRWKAERNSRLLLEKLRQMQLKGERTFHRLKPFHFFRKSPERSLLVFSTYM